MLYRSNGPSWSRRTVPLSPQLRAAYPEAPRT